MQRCSPPTELVQRGMTVETTLFKALADPHRLAILATLARAGQEVCVCDFTAGLPLRQPTVSHHLKVLRDAGLVACERLGTWVYYTLAPDARERLAGALDIILPEKVRA